MSVARTTARATRMVGLSVGQRLLLGLAPSLLAVILVLVLAYYGEFGRQAPLVVVVGAAVLAVISLLVTWSNTRYLALRIRRLAGGVESAATASGREVPEDDELGRIEQVVQRLGEALATSEAERRRDATTALERSQQLALMLGASVRDALSQLDDVRLPLHILIDAPFGELNENQEELLVTARAAAESMDVVLRRLALVSDADRDAIPTLLERVSVNDVARSVLPMLRAAAERRSARVVADLDPSLPRVAADRARLAEAFALLGADCAHGVDDATALQLTTVGRPDAVEVGFAPAHAESDAVRPSVLVAQRLVEAQGGTVDRSTAGFVVRLPVRAVRGHPDAR